MKKQTVFVKRYINKGELPKEGLVLTPRGAWMFHGGKFKCPHDGTIQQGINEWLEGIELPNEEEIYSESRSKGDWYDIENFIKGANFMLKKMKGETK